MIRHCTLFILLIVFSSCLNNNKQDGPVQDGLIIEAGIEFKTKKAEDLNDRASAYYEKNRFIEAKKLLLIALEIEPENYVILNNIGLMESNLGNVAEAVDYYRQSYSASDYKYIPAASNLALTYYKAEMYSEAIDISLFVLDRNPSHGTKVSTYLTLSLAYCDSGKCKKAQDYLLKLKDIINSTENLDAQINQMEQRLRGCVQKSN